MNMTSLPKMRERFYIHWSWWLLLLTFALTFFLPERRDARNLYRVMVALPVLIMLSGPVLKGFFASKPMRWFAALSMYFALTLVWSVEFKSLDNHLLRILSVWGLAFLLYYVAQFRPELFARIDKVLVCFGVVWGFLLIIDWSSLYQTTPHLDRWTVSYGAFTHHRQVGWMLAVLSLLSLQHALRNGPIRYLWMLITVFFFVFLILVQARGGLLVFFVGALATLLIHFRSLNWRLVTIVGSGIFCAAALVSVFLPELINSLVSRGAAGRFDIWQNWFSTWLSSEVKMLFGYGLGADTKNIVGHYTAVHFHNFYLNTAFYGGIVGFCLTVCWFSSIARSIYQNRSFDSPWFPVLVGVLFGFLTDGDKLFNYPGAFVFCFLLPVFCLSFAQGHDVQVQ